MSHVISIKLSDSLSKLKCPKTRPLFKIKPNVAADPVFKERLTDNMVHWQEVRRLGVSTLTWWEYMVKPGIKKLAIERGKEINKDKRSVLNLLLLRQGYLTRKVQLGFLEKLTELKTVQLNIDLWYQHESEKIKYQSKFQDVLESESIRIYHHSIHQKNLQKICHSQTPN
jgi:hypothetical protein